ncbi:bestrophin family protein [Zeaxanthinibacter enoshimensis]|uniref:Putative membrane protein n=1 Tax=Zeaxanthinibacter enoshimensis TaxID=392009 RepID=A0A4R6TS66_9FLAO|nr:bestrophin family ion channel [Zeaxanthinibacter enoshimensis]TDQ33003.1 putative membrane protein [Zeaxanthinibacter enoshimensis]
MYIKRNISWKLILRYAWKNMLLFVLYSLAIFYMYHYLGWYFIDIPFEPLTIIGIAVAFYLGFKNSQSYDRFWEGRKIWGGIVNYSRTWAINVLSFVDTGNEEQTRETKRQLVHRHLAWVNALRVQLRQKRPWTREHGTLVESLLDIHGERNKVSNEAFNFVSLGEYEELKQRVNPATHIIKNQALVVAELRKKEYIDGFQEQQLMSVLEELYNLQGMCERIKNTPFPRQYAYFTKVFTWLFVLLVPLGLLNIFESHVIGESNANDQTEFLFLQMIPFTVLIMWIFTTMEMIGDISEDPFEGSTNDVPMTSLCRTIEIDLRDMLDEKDLPESIEPKDNILY